MIEEASKILDEQKLNDHKEYREKLEALFKNKEEVSFSPKCLDETFSKKLLANKETFNVGTTNGGRIQYLDYHLIRNLRNPFAQQTGGYHLYSGEAERRQFRVIDGNFPSRFDVNSADDYGTQATNSNEANTRVWTQRIVDHPVSITMGEEIFEDLTEGDYDTIIRGLDQTGQDRECRAFATNNDGVTDVNYQRGGTLGLKGLPSYTYDSTSPFATSYDETNGNHTIIKRTYTDESGTPDQDDYNRAGATIISAIKQLDSDMVVNCALIGRPDLLSLSRFRSTNTFTTAGQDSFPLEKFGYTINDQTAYWLGVPTYVSNYLNDTFGASAPKVSAVITSRDSGIRFELHGDLKLKVFRQTTVGSVTLFMNRRVVSTILSPDRVVAIGAL